MRDRNKNTLNKENKGKIDAHSEEGCSENDFFWADEFIKKSAS